MCDLLNTRFLKHKTTARRNIVNEDGKDKISKYSPRFVDLNDKTNLTCKPCDLHYLDAWCSNFDKVACLQIGCIIYAEFVATVNNDERAVDISVCPCCRVFSTRTSLKP